MTIIHLTREGLAQEQTTAAVVDLVAVPGIFEDALETWTDPASNILWLRDLLLKRSRDVRVLLYKYKAAALTSPGEGTADRILAQATTLVAELYAERQLDNASTRPIIFVCHDLGGLLAKRALTYSGSRRNRTLDHLRSIYTSTFGILFLGTPHTGINKNTLLLTQESHSPGPSQFMINLLKGSEMLNEINDQFAPIMKQFSIYNFWEDMETSFGERRAYIVDQDSAAPAWDDVEKCGIMGTHSTMTKFSSHSDPKYRLVLEALSRYIKHAPALIRSRWTNEQKYIARERQRELEELLRIQLPIIATEESPITNKNEWCLVPRSSSAFFTGRRKHANEVREMLGPIRSHDDKKRNEIVVLFGLGGSGKTQFCLKYVEDHKHRYSRCKACSPFPDPWLTSTRYWGVFWVDASRKKNIKAGFASIGEQAGRGTSMTAGIHWLSKSHEPWLLILDNADDTDLQIEEYCPPGGNGHILITTRNPRAAEQARTSRLRFRGMEAQDAVSFLLKSAYPSGQHASTPRSPRTWKLAERIAIELGFLPLALSHAGATIRRNIYTIERYLDYYLGCRKLTMSYSKINTAEEANIITTWEIPFQKIVSRGSAEHKDAVDLMHIFAFLHFEIIPESIFQRPWVSLTGESSQAYSEHVGLFPEVWDVDAQARFRRAIGVLSDHSIIDHEPSKASCSMHPVVHNWARDRLGPDEQKHWLQCAMAALAQCISPSLEAAGRQFRATLLPHINSCLHSHNSGGLKLPETLQRAAEYERFAWVYAERGLWKSARKWQQKVVQIRLKLLGQRNDDTIRAQRSLGQTLWNLFEIKEAITLQLQVLNTLRWHRPSIAEWTVWPFWKPIHIPYCIALDDLTLTLWLAGRRELSKRTGERAVDGLTKRLGPEDPQTLNAMFNLARTYFHLGEHDRSHRLLVRVLKLRKHFFGLNHPETLMVRNELGTSLCARQRHMAAAQRLIENVLKERTRILGAEHAYTLWSVNDLSKVYVERGRISEGIKVLEDIIPIVKRTLGEKHVGMFMTRSNLGRAYYVAEQWKKAEETIGPLLADIPADHPDLIHNLYGYAHIKFNLGATDEAEKLCLDMLDRISTTKVLALDNPRTIAIANLLLKIYRLQGREADVTALQTSIPGSDGKGSEVQSDPYAARRISEASLPLPDRSSGKHKIRSGSKSVQIQSHVTGEPVEPRSGTNAGPKPKLAISRTF